MSSSVLGKRSRTHPEAEGSTHTDTPADNVANIPTELPGQGVVLGDEPQDDDDDDDDDVVGPVLGGDDADEDVGPTNGRKKQKRHAGEAHDSDIVKHKTDCSFTTAYIHSAAS